MQNLTINPKFIGKTITKKLPHGTQKIEVDKLRPSQYGRIYAMGFEEIFLTEKDNGKEREHTSNEEATNSGGTTPVVERVQTAPKKSGAKRTNSKPKNG